MYGATAVNLGFSAMLAEEYVLIDISLISCNPGGTKKAKQQNITSTALILLSNGSGLKEHRISAQQKALDVVCNFGATHP